MNQYQSSINKLTSIVRDKCMRDAERAYNVFLSKILDILDRDGSQRLSLDPFRKVVDVEHGSFDVSNPG